MALISDHLYLQILEHMPILCVDLVLVHQGKVLLTYRTQEPAKDQWWIQGGRVLKNERLTEAVQRLAKREIGIPVHILRQIGTYEFFSEKGPLAVQTGIHDVAVVYLVEPTESDFKLQLDFTHAQSRWISFIEDGLDPYIKTVLNDAGVFD